MKEHFITTALLLSLASPSVYAASNISAKFDGTYHAAVEAVPWMNSGSSCGSLVVETVNIKNGLVSAAARDVPGAIRGFITEEGYLEATIMSPEGRSGALNGRLEDGMLSAGAIDQNAGCAWLVKLTPQIQANQP